VLKTRLVSTATSQTRSAHSRTAFINDRLGSALAILPLGVWTLSHLWNNLSAFSGAAAWQSAVTEYPHPLAQGITFVVVLIPLVWHTVWGISRLTQTRPNYPRYGYFANLKYILQRISAIGLLLFLGAHLWLAFLHPRLVEGRAEPFADIAHEMHFHGPTLMVYILGVLAIAYHLGNGAQQALMTWGAVTSRRALRQWELLAWVLFVLILALGWGAVYALYRAGAAT
jgi:succinate dehydrogenase / fumarate reductase cytochrome b subunit